MNKPKIGISIGDLNGINCELIIKTFSDERILNICTPILYGSSKPISYYKNVLNNNDFQFHTISDALKAKDDAFNILNCWNETININPGTVDPEQGIFALRALEAVAYDALENKIDAIVTAPVNKHTIHAVAPDFVGQTEFFTQKCQQHESLMLLANDQLRIALATNHLPLHKVSKSLSAKHILQKIELLEQSLKRDFLLDKPLIAVLSLNPHAGDNGLLGTEDAQIIAPAIEQAKALGIFAMGPFAADGFFGNGLHLKFDAILAMYHDQGLIPFKLLAFENGVNITAGLSIVRTSPDHGPAYDIAGKGIANETSFRQAIFAAIDLLKNRASYDEMRGDALNRSSIEREDETATAENLENEE
ncbi:MAG: 4-hydroxythreonine-4-phosphate dehydrogenase PdxA [Chitinophagales bacterium]|nr:4-hydroxythreonine-4-phosphate dehydrogenase PdxA [Bacteroidota bacterium]